MLIKIVNDYLDLGFDEGDIGVISPYSDQVNIISNETDVEVKTVDGFQGGEKEILLCLLFEVMKMENLVF